MTISGKLLRSRVPQGSVLFLSYINDIVDEVGFDVTVGIFADDILPYTKVKFQGNQENLNLLVDSVNDGVKDRE